MHTLGDIVFTVDEKAAEVLDVLDLEKVRAALYVNDGRHDRLDEEKNALEHADKAAFLHLLSVVTHLLLDQVHEPHELLFQAGHIGLRGFYSMVVEEEELELLFGFVKFKLSGG